ncbi:unnamed protein product (macronuclear) [Paramecium tetraurelia]|uniref:Uncharacterized protein n=1 Tax=Paramecium tetraurelia TaxID=5888 RepID=A0C4K3_PARTE|nr:uncharacterized protein GSPATT00006218001 [Paramecium tetraurelia]CAK65720.1 unnamed protein product [Paramecium tetraurelia]|eukprot:XP_001433117.1 hypothetical protein (macronuclear) [Paramecium tetraurelia strain d4-2]
MNQQLDDSKESVKSQSLERYLQVESTKNSLSPARQVQTTRPAYESSILKLQNGKFSNSQSVFQDALNKKKCELIKKPQKSVIEMPKKPIPQPEKQVKKFDKVQQNIKQSQLKSEEVKKKKEEQKQKEQEKQKNEAVLESDEAFLETVNRLYDFEKRRTKQLQKMVDEEKNKEKQKTIARPFINQKSCILLDRKLKQMIEEDESYKQICQFKDMAVQADLLPNLPKIKDFQIINQKNINLTKSQQQIVIVMDLEFKEEAEVAEDIQYKEDQSHKVVQTKEIKYKVGDTIKKQEQGQQPAETKQFQEKETPKKQKVNNQRQKRQEIMETQEQRIKTECEYYVPIHIRQQQIIQKKQEWVKQQQEMKRHHEEEQEKQFQEQWEKEKEKFKKNSFAEVNVEEFVNQQISWLEKRNDHILTEQIKKDKEVVQQLTFRPQIKRRGTNNYDKNDKVELRLLDYQQKKQENLMKLENKYLPTFKPNLTQKSLLSMDWASKSFTNASFNNLWS